MTETEEMYLITIARLAEREGDELVPLSELADELTILPASANQMVHKLEGKGLLGYAPYHGVRLLPDGRRIANRVLRRRRLWEVFLVRHLKLLPHQADELACRLEHITPPDLAERLSTYLGDPRISTQGLPIPGPEKESAAPSTIPLTGLKAGQEAEIDRMELESEAARFLGSEGLQSGTRVLVIASAESGAALVEANGRQLALSRQLAEGIWVKGPAPGRAAGVWVGTDAL